eukprot:scaffold925_cov133-Isochrysis_galbana.AAC.6
MDGSETVKAATVGVRRRSPLPTERAARTYNRVPTHTHEYEEKNKIPRTRLIERWRPDPDNSFCRRWRTTCTRSRALSGSARPATKRARCRCNCAPARAPVAPLGLALRTGWHCWHFPGPMARACRSWLLAREECAAKTLLSVAATPFTTTASAVYYNPLRRTKWTSPPYRGMECYPNRFGTINRHYHPPKIPPNLRDRWESLQVTVVHNTFSDREGKWHYTKDENRSYIDTELD